MRLLMDTHSFLWFIGGSSKLSSNARQLIDDEKNEVFLSVGCLWEIAIKVNIGKLTLDTPFGTLIPQQLSLNRITLLDIAVTHAIALSNLPLHHRDPFDRLIVVQALVEQLPVVSIDTIFDSYGVTRLW